MRLDGELLKIKQNEMNELSEKELLELKEKLVAYKNNAEEVTKVNFWKKMFNILGGICSIAAGVLMLTGVLSISKSLSIGTFLLNYGIATVLLIVTSVLNKLYKKANKNYNRLINVCDIKINEVEKILLNVQKKLTDSK